jgi:general secretion pathway protein G
MPGTRRIVGAAVVVATVALAALTAFCVVPSCVERQRRAEARADVEALRTALELHRDREGRYPTTEEGLDRLGWTDRAPAGTELNIPPDPWGNAYEYVSDGRTYRLVSRGADGRPGGSGRDADIVTVGDGRR